GGRCLLARFELTDRERDTYGRKMIDHPLRTFGERAWLVAEQDRERRLARRLVDLSKRALDELHRGLYVLRLVHVNDDDGPVLPVGLAREARAKVLDDERVANALEARASGLAIARHVARTGVGGVRGVGCCVGHRS